MKGFIIFTAICLAICILGNACSEETVTYYKDSNGNGREDWGEAVWYEDSDGVHFLD